VGLVATAALYRAALGDTVLDQPALTSRDNLPKLLQVERRLVGDDDSSDSLLCPARGPAVPAFGAFLTTEKFVVDYNAGSMPSDNCGSGKPPPSDLVPLYATDGTPFLDYPFVRVDHPDRPRSPQRERLIGRLYDFLTSPAARQLLLHSGFRDIEDNVDSAVLPTEKPLPMTMPPPAVVTALPAVWAQARRPANVVLAVDTSTAMATPFSHVGGTQLTAVTEALNLALPHIGSRDRIGLWQVAGPARPRRIVPLGPAGSASAPGSPAAAVGAQLVRLRSSGPAARLGDAVAAGAAALRGLDPAAAREAANAVVLIAGADAEPAAAAAPALPAGIPVQVFVVGFTDQVCRSRAVTELTSTTGGACYPVHAAVDVSRAVDRIAARLWGN
jgi:Ca-activated chloride channel family protein